MKIIHKGRLPSKIIYRGSCHNCSIVQAEREELKLTSDGRNGTDASAVCPLCGVTMYFYPEEE